LEVVLGVISLITVVVSLSSEVVTSIVPLALVVSLSLSWCPVSVDIHRDRGIVHPSWGIQ